MSVGAANALTAAWASASPGAVFSGAAVYPLLALLATVAAGPARAELRAVAPTPLRLPVRAALGVFTREGCPLALDWAARCDPRLTGDPAIDRPLLDAWAAAQAGAPLPPLPLPLTDAGETALVLASALSPATDWREPFTSGVLRPATGPWAGRRLASLHRRGPDLTVLRVAHTPAAGPVTVLTVAGTTDLDVVLCTAAGGAPPAAVLSGAAAALATAAPVTQTAAAAAAGVTTVPDTAASAMAAPDVAAPATHVPGVVTAPTAHAVGRVAAAATHFPGPVTHAPGSIDAWATRPLGAFATAATEASDLTAASAAPAPGVTAAYVDAHDAQPELVVKVPRFTATATHDLLRFAELFGLRAATTTGTFPGIGPAALRIGTAAQSAAVAFTAPGFRPSPPTRAPMVPMPRQPPTTRRLRITARFDAPFGYLAVHRPTGLIVAAGWVTDPEEAR